MSGVHLEPELGIWRKLIEMVSGQPAVIRRTPALSLRPLLEADPTLGEVELPEHSDWLPSAEHNRAVLRFLALQLAARRLFGSYEQQPSSQLRAASPQVQALFLVAEGVRVQHRVGLAYPGTLDDTRTLAAALLGAWHAEPPSDFARVCDVLLAAALADAQPQQASPLPVGAHHDDATQPGPTPSLHASLLPAGVHHDDATQLGPAPSLLWLPAALTRTLLNMLHTLRADDAAAFHSLAVARELAVTLSEHDALAVLPLPAALASCIVSQPPGLPLPAANAPRQPPTAAPAAQPVPADASDFFSAHTSVAALQSALSQARGFGAQSSDEEHESSADLTHAQSRAAPTTDKQDLALPQAAAAASSLPRSFTARSSQRRGVQSFAYDEWDHTLHDYRPQYCRVQELPLAPDSGQFFERTMLDARDLLKQVRRQFEQLRPERYRPLHGLEDGEDFDLNALTDARIAARAGHPARTRIYTSRVREARDVATLFLLDMSASTEQKHGERRIIDTLKEALVVMTAALEKLGDQYAIYGFSSRGHDRVEVYPIKSFREPLDHSVKARIGGIEPKSGTRMGAALRHMIRKFSGVSARSKHVMLLSDGYPQDHDYGPDRRTHTYGIEDTAVALRELSAAGPLPFCITVDRAGNDYLRLMCDPSQYLVIDDVGGLPRELPKIYRRVARE